MLTFDAATREECQVNRAVSTTPLQALVLLNDPIYVEAAIHFARRMLAEGGESLERQIEWGFEVALARKPMPDELEILTGLFRREQQRFSSTPAEARQLLAAAAADCRSVADEPSLADHVAMTVVARALLNLSETITRY
jgi:hypothetical protein